MGDGPLNRNRISRSENFWQIAVLSRRPAREFLENTVELRQGLKPDCECYFADPAVGVFQKIACFFEAEARDVIDKVYAGYILEFLAQIIAADVNCSCDSLERKLFV